MSQDMKELCEGMQTLLHRSEPLHSTSSRSVTPPLWAAGLSTQQPHEEEAHLVHPSPTAAAVKPHIQQMRDMITRAYTVSKVCDNKASAASAPAASAVYTSASAASASATSTSAVTPAAFAPAAPTSAASTPATFSASAASTPAASPASAVTPAASALAVYASAAFIPAATPSAASAPAASTSAATASAPHITSAALVNATIFYALQKHEISVKLSTASQVFHSAISQAIFGRYPQQGIG